MCIYVYMYIYLYIYSYSYTCLLDHSLNLQNIPLSRITTKWRANSRFSCTHQPQYIKKKIAYKVKESKIAVPAVRSAARWIGLLASA